MPQLKWKNHADLAIKKTPTVGRAEYLDHMTFKRNVRPLFTEIFGPIIGLKEEWEAQGATAAAIVAPRPSALVLGADTVVAPGVGAGVVRVHGTTIVRKKSWLIRPPRPDSLPPLMKPS